MLKLGRYWSWKTVSSHLKIQTKKTVLRLFDPQFFKKLVIIMSNIEFEIMPLPSLVPMRFRLGHSWTLPWAVTSPRDTRQALRSLARFLPDFARTMDQERTPSDKAGLYPVHGLSLLKLGLILVTSQTTRCPSLFWGIKEWTKYMNRHENSLWKFFTHVCISCLL